MFLVQQIRVVQTGPDCCDEVNETVAIFPQKDILEVWPLFAAIRPHLEEDHPGDLAAREAVLTDRFGKSISREDYQRLIDEKEAMRKAQRDDLTDVPF